MSHLLPKRKCRFDFNFSLLMLSVVFLLAGIQKKPSYLCILSTQGAAFVGVTFSCLAAIGVPLWFRCSRHGPDWTRGTLHTWYLCSVAAVMLPYLVALCQGWEELISMPLIQRMLNAPPRFPSLVTCALVDADYIWQLLLNISCYFVCGCVQRHVR